MKEEHQSHIHLFGMKEHIVEETVKKKDHEDQY